MPEGDTVYRSAQTLAKALSGRTVTDASARAPAVGADGARRLVGQTVQAVEARGKHLLVWFASGELALHTHLRMAGAWHLYRRGQPWRRAPQQARVVLETDPWLAVCFSAGVCELLSRAQVGRHAALAGLGPDALDPAVDLAEARRRLDERAEWTVGEALLEQAVLAGVGNVYKAEACHLVGVSPWCRVAELDADRREALLRAACRLLRANAGPQRRPRVTTGQPGRERLAVYGRAGRACRRCGAVIRVARQGNQARLTYWCPGCQDPDGRGKAGTGPSGGRAC